MPKSETRHLSIDLNIKKKVEKNEFGLVEFSINGKVLYKTN